MDGGMECSECIDYIVIPESTEYKNLTKAHQMCVIELLVIKQYYETENKIDKYR